MNAIILNGLISTLAHLVAAILQSGVFDEIQKLVELEMNSNKTNAEKLQAVKDALKNVGGELGNAIRSTAGWAINLGIETAVAKAKTKAGVPVTL